MILNKPSVKWNVD